MKQEVSCNTQIIYPKTIREDVDWLLNSPPVVSVVGNELKKLRDLVEGVNSYYQEEYGGKAFRSDIGEIKLSRKGIQTSIAHGIGKNKRAAFIAVPEVLINGRIIQIDPNHKGRNYESIIIAAPIKIWHTVYICEVVVNRSKDESGFYLHNVDIKQKLLSGTEPVRTYNGEDQMRKTTSKASKLIISDVVNAVKENRLDLNI